MGYAWALLDPLITITVFCVLFGIKQRHGFGGGEMPTRVIRPICSPACPADATREEFLAFYRDHLTITLDELSGILTVSLQTFDPDYSKRVVALMLKESDGFINRLSHQVPLEQLSFVESQVAHSYEQLLGEQDKMLAFQNQHQLISPEATSTAMLGIVAELEAELVRQDAELKRLEIYMNPNAPDMIAVKDRVSALTRQLVQEKKCLPLMNGRHSTK